MDELHVVNSEISNQKPEIKKHKNSRFSVFVFFAIVIVIGYLILHICMSFGKTYSVYTVSRGEYEDIITAEGYIFRNQNIINAPTGGFLDCLVSENERVAVGTEVATVYNKLPDDEVNAQLKKLDDEIAELSIAKIKDTAYRSREIGYNQGYANEIKEAVAYGYSKDFSGISEVADTLSRDIRKLRLSEEDTKETEANEETMLAELKAERERLISENGMVSKPIVAETSGVFSSKIDGLEEELAVEQLSDITPTYIKGLAEKEIKSVNNVETGTPVCKIINNFEWYYAAVIPYNEAAALTVNRSVSLRFFDITNDMISGTITYISPDENGEAVVVIKSDKYIDSIYTLSKTSVDIVKNIYSGLKIPTNGIRVVDNKTGVYVCRQGIARFVKADVIYSDEKWAIVKEITENDGSSIKPYDELILNARNLYDGKVMD